MSQSGPHVRQALYALQGVSLKNMRMITEKKYRIWQMVLVSDLKSKLGSGWGHKLLVCKDLKGP